MVFNDFKKKLQTLPVFSLADVRLVAPDFHRPQLTRWVQKGLIVPLRRGYYMFADASPVSLGEAGLFLIANKIYPHSYVSLESALSYHGLIPEGVYTITAVTTANTAQFVTVRGNFSYRHLKPDLFFGYTLLKNGARLATAEKAILDFLYFHSELRQPADFTELRLASPEWCTQARRSILLEYATAYPKSVQKRLGAWLEFITQPN
jgi:predicted transcriptional regulator of viral defense system